MRKKLAALLVAFMATTALNACVPVSTPEPGPDGGVDPAVAPCTRHPENAPQGTVISGTLCVEVIDNKAKLLRRFVDIHVDATDQYGGKGGNTSAGRYPFDKTVDSSWSHDIFLGLGTQREPLVLDVRWTAIYQGAPGDWVVCYMLSPAGYEVHDSYVHKQVQTSTKPVTVSCAATLHTGGNDA